MEDPYAQYEVMKRAWIPQMHRRSLPPENLEFLQTTPELSLEDIRNLMKYLNALNLTPEDLINNLNPEDYYSLIELLRRIDVFGLQPEDLLRQDDDSPENFQDDFPESRIYFDENDDPEEYGSGFYNTPKEIFRELKTKTANNEIFRELKNKQQQQHLQHPKIYTEGGVVYDSGQQQDNNENQQDFNDILNRYNLGFKRPERLDVKKPGPPFDPQITDDKRGICL